MDAHLIREALAKYLTGLCLVALLLFVPAGTLAWPCGWLLVTVLFGPMLAVGLVMLTKSPDLLRSRLSAREGEPGQRVVVAIVALQFVVAFVVAGLGWRLAWPQLPEAVSYGAAVCFLAGYALYAEVLRENEWLSRTVEVREGQRLVDTGLYGVVRHPMYAATLVLFLTMPLVLGSLASLIIMLPYIPLVARRALMEERVLEAELEGYIDYERRVRWRLVPHVW